MHARLVAAWDEIRGTPAGVVLDDHEARLNRLHWRVVFAAAAGGFLSQQFPTLASLFGG